LKAPSSDFLSLHFCTDLLFFSSAVSDSLVFLFSPLVSPPAVRFVECGHILPLFILHAEEPIAYFSSIACSRPCYTAPKPPICSGLAETWGLPAEDCCLWPPKLFPSIPRVSLSFPRSWILFWFVVTCPPFECTGVQVPRLFLDQFLSP